jgi:hypothetical protein
MDSLKNAILLAKKLMDTPLTLWGFTFSFWQIFLWVMVASLVLWFIWRVFND